MKTFNELVSIKDLREQKAGRTVALQRLALQDAVRARDEARQALDAFRNIAAQKESAAYEKLYAGAVRVGDIQQVNALVSNLRMRQAKHQDTADQAEGARGQEEAHLLRDRSLHAHAMRMRDKFAQVAASLETEAQGLRDLQEEAEIQEAAETGWLAAAAARHGQ
ncbi:MAG: YscO family type III secretion system apparatus protein [Burkholderiaceae bacterium]|nr:YscO family type III secretion system apparatus protein [Burkholderiaceae bacterium]